MLDLNIHHVYAPDHTPLYKRETGVLFVMFLAMLFAVASNVGAQTPAIAFTDDESAYIRQSTGIKMCVDPDWAPFERITADGRHEGIGADLVQLVAKRVGLRIDLYPVKSWDESLAASLAGRCQIMSFLNATPKREEWLRFTEPIFTIPIF